MSNTHIIPAWASWIVPEQEHTDEQPFCRFVDNCLCHHDPERMETYFIEPVSRGELEIEQAIDLYHCEPGYMARHYAESREAVLIS